MESVNGAFWSGMAEKFHRSRYNERRLDIHPFWTAQVENRMRVCIPVTLVLMCRRIRGIIHQPFTARPVHWRNRFRMLGYDIDLVCRGQLRFACRQTPARLEPPVRSRFEAREVHHAHRRYRIEFASIRVRGFLAVSGPARQSGREQREYRGTLSTIPRKTKAS